MERIAYGPAMLGRCRAESECNEPAKQSVIDRELGEMKAQIDYLEKEFSILQEIISPVMTSTLVPAQGKEIADSGPMSPIAQTLHDYSERLRSIRERIQRTNSQIQL